MMDWTDRHCRFLHRLLSRRAVLYTEMVTVGAVLHGDRERLLGFDPAEHPVVLQLGGSEPAALAEAARIGEDFGYDGINLNVGCPSDRVQSGAFGACLMREPGLVADCVAAMGAAVKVPVTVKCRIGVDDQNPAEILPAFIDRMAAAGCRHVIVHARKAWLKGLSPKENRTVPPLDYDLVASVKAARPDLAITINGGIDSLDKAGALLARGFDGVMIGRSAWSEPTAILAGADRRIFGEKGPDADPLEVVERMRPYIARHLTAGGRLNTVTRPMLGLFAGRPGARVWRRVISERAHRRGAGLEVLDTALAAIRHHAEQFEEDRGAEEGRAAALVEGR